MYKAALVFSLALAATTLAANAQTQMRLDTLAGLDARLNESSGLLCADGRLFSHNDSGGEAALYELDTTTAQVLKTIYLRQATNVDWEDIAQDSNYIYIGDFGNNTGSRQDLRIYRVDRTQVLAAADGDSLTAEGWGFAYADQDSFPAQPFVTAWDAEAFVAFGDSLYIFSKNWGTQRCEVRALPKTPQPSAQAILVDSFNSQGLVTGASYQDGELLLCGYGFVGRVETWAGRMPTGVAWRWPLAWGNSVQVEGIAHRQQMGRAWLSNEQSLQRAARLYRVWWETVVGVALADDNPADWIAYPNPATDFIQWQSADIQRTMLVDALGVVVAETAGARLEVQGLAAGSYWLLGWDAQGRRAVRAVVLN